MNVSLREKKYRFFVQLALVALVLSTLLVGSIGMSPAVEAGSNGQMIWAGNACSNPATITWIRVKGRNQDGKYAVWEQRPNSSGVLTRNWWWKGMVSIEWRTNRDSYLHATAYDVPSRYQRDYVAVLLDRWGC